MMVHHMLFRRPSVQLQLDVVLVLACATLTNFESLQQMGNVCIWHFIQYPSAALSELMTVLISSVAVSDYLDVFQPFSGKL